MLRFTARAASAKNARIIAAALWLCALVMVIYAAMASIAGVDPCACDYNSYQLQAQAWLRGETALDRNYEYLELAHYNGKHYVSFPPVPSIPWVLLTLCFGENVYGGLVQKIWIMIACLVVFFEILRTRRMDPAWAAAWSAGVCLAGALLPVGLIGGVWYEAQILAFLLSVSAAAAIRRNRPTLCCFLYALAVGCRPFAALLGPALLAVYLRRKGSLRRLAPGICLGLVIAACYGAYNYARFGDIFEFGHNHLPEFTRAEHGQMSPHYVAGNLRQMLLGLPFLWVNGEIRFYEFGFSMFFSCPVLICGLVWLIRDLFGRRMSAVKWVCLVMAALNVLLLSAHRTLGGHQFGLRYALELIPYCLIWLLEDRRRSMRPWEAVLLFLGLGFNFIGGSRVHILRYL